MKQYFRRWETLLPVGLGVCAFLFVGGPRILEFSNIAWLGGNLDPAQQYLGWALFRIGPWTMPFGLNPFYGLDFSKSIAFSDSIPLAAFLFKPLAEFLPNAFQYFGLWTLTGFVLQAWFAWQLIGLITNNLPIRVFASGFFVFSPPMMIWVGLWTPLFSHFLILAGLYLNFKKDQQNRSLYWAILVSVGALVNFYLFIMVMILWAGSLLDILFIKKQLPYLKAFYEIALIFLWAIFFLWQAGYLSVDPSSGAGEGFGLFGFNLLALFNSRGWSYFLPEIPMQIDFGNGYNYLGLGTLILLFFAFLAKLRSRCKLPEVFKGHFFLYSCLIGLFIFSLSNSIGIGLWRFTIPMSEQLVGIASVLRASGRMFWPIFYFLIFMIISYILVGYKTKNALTILGLCLLMQVVDTSAGWLPLRNNLMKASFSEHNTPLKNEAWEQLGGHYQKLVRFPVLNRGPEWEIFASYAVKHRMATNSAFLSRVEQQSINQAQQKINQQLRNGPLDPRALYIIDVWKNNPTPLQFDSEKDVLARIDGYTILAPGWKICPSCSPVPLEFQVQRLAPITKIGKSIEFSQKAFGRREFLLEGWAPYGEAWGTWSDGISASLLLPVPVGNPKMIRLTVRAFVNAKHPIQQVYTYINGTLVKYFELSNFASNVMDIPIPPAVLTDEYFKLELKIQSPASPKALGLSDDDRQLGIGVISAVFQ